MGTNFWSDAHCRFGAAAGLDTTVVSSTLMFCASPSQPAGPYTLEVTNNDHDYTRYHEHYVYYDPPAVAAIYPTSGPLWGFTEVTVDGARFVSTYNLTCKFGSHPSVHSTWVSSTRLRCLSPVHTTGATTTTLEISNNDQDLTDSGVVWEFQGTHVVRWPVVDRH